MQIFEINGVVLAYITKANWQDSLAGEGLDGKSPLNRRRRHSWRAEVMTVTEFDSLYALEGQRVNLTTTNYSDRNGDYVTYYHAELVSVAGKHEGPVMTDVGCEFVVRV